MDLGGIILTLAVLGVLGWLTFLVTQTRIRRRREAAPQNLSPFLTDDELESGRLSRVLGAALISTAVIAIVMPVYYLNETGRQEAAAETFHEIAVERGHHWYEEFGCGDCHGADGGGGGASFIEARSGIEITWAAPALNDILYVYSEEEVLYWLTFGRQGTPMPAWGVEGGGPMNSQQLEELVAYLEYIQISQDEAIAQVEGKVTREISRLEGAVDSVEAVENRLMDDIANVAAAPRRYEEVKGLPAELTSLLSSDGTCTDETAAVVGLACGEAGADTDRDGISDATEQALPALIDAMLQWTPAGANGRNDLQSVGFDAQNAFTTAEGSRAIPDLDQIDTVVDAFETIERDLRLTLDGREALLETALGGLDYVKAAASVEAWTIDVEAIAAAEFDGNVADAQRGAALYNAYCARCHTAGYSAGVTFTREAGSGGFGPSLRDGRSVVQFPDETDHLNFIINGSVNGQLYGVNGVGRGWMPGFGTILSEEDLMLIVKFERALR